MWSKWSGTHQVSRREGAKTVLGIVIDANGNTLSDPSGKSYSWDFENRLVQAVVPGTGTVSFKYDPFGRRIYKQSPSFTSVFVYDGPNLIETTNGSGSEVASYTQIEHYSGGSFVDQPLAELRSGTADYYEQDGLGSVTSLSNSASALANTYAYDSFGNTTASTGTLRNYFQYTGREFDSEIGIYYYRARFYDPNSGRFMSEDPERFGQGGDFYVYVGNAPTLLIDPTGLAACCPTANANQIQSDADNARKRLWALQTTGTAVLPTDTGASVGAMTGCLAGGVVKGTNIGVPSQYVIAMMKDPNKDPCGYQCELAHERVHAKQCMALGAGFFSMTEAQKEIPAYMMELGCLLKMQMDNGLGPYHQ
jgi:RHS repeat-associated protein